MSTFERVIKEADVNSRSIVPIRATGTLFRHLFRLSKGYLLGWQRDNTMRGIEEFFLRILQI